MQRALWLWSIGNLFCVSKAHGFDGCDRDCAKQMPAIYDVLFFTSSAELKMELLREKEMREGLEKQLSEEQKNKGRYLQHHTKQYKLWYLIRQWLSTLECVDLIMFCLVLQPFYYDESRKRSVLVGDFRNKWVALRAKKPKISSTMQPASPVKSQTNTPLVSITPEQPLRPSDHGAVLD